MSLSGWLAVGCWAGLAVLILGTAGVMARRERRRRRSAWRVELLNGGVISINDARLLEGLATLPPLVRRQGDFRDWRESWEIEW